MRNSSVEETDDIPRIGAASARAVYGTRKHRAQDLVEGDVVRNRFGKWDVVTEVLSYDGSPHYVNVMTEVGGAQMLRTVHLVDVQVVKPS